MQSLLVNEIFETIQGEGHFTGLPSIFVRLQGCPVGCPWCDTKHTWDIVPTKQISQEDVIVKTGDSPHYFKTSAKPLLDIVNAPAYSARHVVITGGEPCMYDLLEFTSLLDEAGFSSQIETSGTYEVKCSDNTWVTLSPKIDMKAKMPIISQAMQRANEIKHPISMQKHIDELDELLSREGLDKSENGAKNLPNVYLQPISQQTRATELAVNTCIKRNWRLSVQLHKYIGVE